MRYVFIIIFVFVFWGWLVNAEWVHKWNVWSNGRCGAWELVQVYWWPSSWTRSHERGDGTTIWWNGTRYRQINWPWNTSASCLEWQPDTSTNDFDVTLDWVDWTSSENWVLANELTVEISYDEDSVCWPAWCNSIDISWEFHNSDGSGSTTITSTSHSFSVDLTDLWGANEQEFELSIDNIDTNATSNHSQNVRYDWRVFANEPVTPHFSNDFYDTRVGNDSDNFRWRIRLRDEHGNYVVPVQRINREVRVNFGYDNHVYLQQYKKDWEDDLSWGDSWIRYQRTADSSYSKFDIWNWNNINYTYDYSDGISDWVYDVDIKSYVPTYDWYDLANWTFSVEEFSYQVTDNMGNNWSNSDSSAETNLSFEPRSKVSEIDWLPPMANEDGEQDFEVELDNASSEFMIKYDPDWEPIDTYIDWNEYCVTTYWFDSDAFDWDSDCNEILSSSTRYDFTQWFERHSGETLDPGEFGYISTHFGYDYGGGVYATWNSELIWRTNYNYNPEERDLAMQSAMWVEGAISAEDFDALNEIYTDDERHSHWWLSRSELRNQVRKSVWGMKWGIDGNSWGGSVSLWNSSTSERYQNTYVHFFDDDIYIDSSNVNEQNLVATEWWDVFIKDNIRASDDWLLWIVSLMDDDYNWWSIYIHKDVTHIDAFLYAEKGVSTYKWDWDDPEFNLTQHERRHQLYIEGSLWSFNTMWWSTRDEPECPYFVQLDDTETCDTETSRKYDLEFLRRTYLVSADAYWADSYESFIPYYDENEWWPAELIWGIECEVSGDVVECTRTSWEPILEDDEWQWSDPFECDQWWGACDLEDFIHKLSPIYLRYDNRVTEKWLPIFSEVVN